MMENILSMTRTPAQRIAISLLLAQGYVADQVRRNGRIRMVRGNSIQLVNEDGRQQRGEGACRG